MIVRIMSIAPREGPPPSSVANPRFRSVVALPIRGSLRLRLPALQKVDREVRVAAYVRDPGQTALDLIGEVGKVA